MPSEVPRKLLSAAIYEQLQTLIWRGDLKGGERLREMDLAEEFGTSQIPVREALHRLEQDGLVTRHPHQGTYVSEFSQEDVAELVILRRHLDERMLRHAINRLTEDDLSELERHVLEMERHAADASMMEIHLADMRFHATICEATGLAAFRALWRTLYGAMVRAMVLTTDPELEDLTEVARIHRVILEALRRRDTERALAANAEHMGWWLAYSLANGKGRVDEHSEALVDPEGTMQD